MGGSREGKNQWQLRVIIESEDVVWNPEIRAAGWQTRYTCLAPVKANGSTLASFLLTNDGYLGLLLVRQRVEQLKNGCHASRRVTINMLINTAHVTKVPQANGAEGGGEILT